MPLTDEHPEAQAEINRSWSQSLISIKSTDQVFYVGDSMTVEGVFVRLPWWKEALIRLHLMRRPLLPMEQFEIVKVTSYSGYDPDQAKWDADAGRL